MTIKRCTAIAGLGITEMGKIYGKTSSDFAVDAIRLALDDAGLESKDMDGLLINGGLRNPITLGLEKELGLKDLRLLNHMNAYGSTAGAMVQYASMAIEAGMANVVACVFADAPLQADTASASAYILPQEKGYSSLCDSYGIFGTIPYYAMWTKRHMELYGTKTEQLGAIAITQRNWALKNERAQMKKPLCMEDYLASRIIADPFHLYDCCLVSNGGIAVIVTRAEAGRSLKQPPVYIAGFGQGHPGTREDNGIVTGARASGNTALRMADITVRDVNMCQIYDCFTYTVLVTLEDYGFCKKGEGGDFVQNGNLGPTGSLPTNTGGGQLSSYYMWGMTPISEAVIQARKQGGERQTDNDYIMVSGNGGLLDYHSTLILTAHE